jgi:hypothetical protein
MAGAEDGVCLVPSRLVRGLLKPATRKFEAANIHDVINSLRGQTAAEAFLTLVLHPQQIRGGHFHRGRLTADELAPRFGTNFFEDSMFGELLQALQENCRSA